MPPESPAPEAAGLEGLFGLSQAPAAPAGERVVKDRAPTYNDEAKRQLTARRKELMLRAMDGRDDLAGLMHCLHQYRFCENFLIWLIAHRYTGDALAELLVRRFDKSVPALVLFLVKECNRRSETVSGLKIVPPA